MNSRTILSQLLQWILRHEFEEGVQQHQGDKKVRRLPCWAQLVGLLFGQLTGHNSLRAIEAGLHGVQKKLYHLGIAFEIRRSTLSDANDTRDARIFESAFYRLLPKAQRLAPKNKLKLKGPLLALDSTTIELCLSLSPWARFHHGKGAMKLHIAIDLAGDLPTVLVLTEGRKHDVTVAHKINFPAGSLLIMDRGYVDFEWMWELTQVGVFFVTRMKKNCRYKVLECRKTDRTQVRVCHQPVRSGRQDHLQPLQGPLAGGTFLQDDEAAVAGEEIRWNQRQCCQNTGVGRLDRVPVARDREISIKARMGNTCSDGGCDGCPLHKP